MLWLVLVFYKMCHAQDGQVMIPRNHHCFGADYGITCDSD